MSREVMDRTPVDPDETFAYGSDVNQFVDVFRPRNEPKGLAIYIHGGFWRSRINLRHGSHLCSALAERGLLCASVEYRRSGETGGGWPATFQDVGRAFAAVRERFQSLGDPVVLGHSAGGHLALLLAANTRDMRGVVALGAVSCLESAYRMQLGAGAVKEFMGGSPEEFPEYYSAADPARHRSAVPRILVHGTDDDVVPISLSREFVTRESDSPCKLIELEGCDHFDVIDPGTEAWRRVWDSTRQLCGC